MKRNKITKTAKFSAVILLALLIAVSAMFLFSCKKTDDTKFDAVYGTGAKSFTMEITDDNGDLKTYKVNTDETTIGDALIKVELIPADSKENGFFSTLNGITADFNTDQSYWGFYISGTYASEGVFTTNIVNGTVYSFKYEKSVSDTSDTVENTENTDAT